MPLLEYQTAIHTQIINHRAWGISPCPRSSPGLHEHHQCPCQPHAGQLAKGVEGRVSHLRTRYKVDRLGSCNWAIGQHGRRHSSKGLLREGTLQEVTTGHTIRPASLVQGNFRSPHEKSDGLSPPAVAAAGELPFPRSNRGVETLSDFAGGRQAVFFSTGYGGSKKRFDSDPRISPGTITFFFTRPLNR